MQRHAVLVALSLALGVGRPAAEPPREAQETQPGLVRVEFIYEKAPFPECHASTLAEAKGGLVAAWFGGTREKHPDVGIWVSRHESGKWTAPVEVANGVEAGGKRFPCWNPVLFQPSQGPLLLFYKVGPSPSRWWGMLLTSKDGGKTWSKPSRLPDGVWGPIKNKPIELPGGTILCGSSDEAHGWQVHMQSTADLGKSWKSVGPLNDGKKMAAIQPAILRHGDKLQILCRTKHGSIAESWSDDNGKTWSELKRTALPNPNSGLDAVTLRDGRHLLVYNPTRRGRSPLHVAVSKDGKDWQDVLVLEKEPGEFSYPAIIQTSGGLVHISYTWKRQRVRHGVIDPAKLQPR